MDQETDEPSEICRQCSGAGCPICGGGEVPFGTFGDDEPEDWPEGKL